MQNPLLSGGYVLSQLFANFVDILYVCLYVHTCLSRCLYIVL